MSRRIVKVKLLGCFDGGPPTYVYQYLTELLKNFLFLRCHTQICGQSTAIYVMLKISHWDLHLRAVNHEDLVRCYACGTVESR
jgi:hypothetical protein